jgi:hypothetical protein
VFRAIINGSEVCHYPGGAKIFRWLFLHKLLTTIYYIFFIVVSGQETSQILDILKQFITEKVINDKRLPLWN